MKDHEINTSFQGFAEKTFYKELPEEHKAVAKQVFKYVCFHVTPDMEDTIKALEKQRNRLIVKLGERTEELQTIARILNKYQPD